MLSEKNQIFQFTMDGAKLSVKPRVLALMYSEIDSRARKLAGSEFERELRITQDGKEATAFHVTVSERMAPYLISSLQETIANTAGMELRLHFQKLQELLMKELFAGAKDVIQIG